MSFAAASSDHSALLLFAGISGFPPKKQVKYASTCVVNTGSLPICSNWRLAWFLRCCDREPSLFSRKPRISSNETFAAFVCDLNYSAFCLPLLASVAVSFLLAAGRTDFYVVVVCFCIVVELKGFFIVALDGWCTGESNSSSS